jgi:uncharacterized protein YebE (UPF0316 family)
MRPAPTGKGGNRLTLDAQILLGALAIFGLRIFGVAISTVRMLIMVQGRRLWTVALGFLESLVFAVAIGSVVTQLDNLWNMLAYCGGFAIGTYIGMMLETRLITNFLTVNIVSAHEAHRIAEVVREAGFGATEGWGQGAEGLVGSVRVVVQRRDVRLVVDVVSRVDPGAFITLDETRAVSHGFIRLTQRPMR